MTYGKNGLYIDEEHLETYGENAARALTVDSAASCRGFAQDVRRALEEIGTVHDKLLLKWDGVHSMPEGVRWLLDNFYLVQREGRTAVMELVNAPKLPFSTDGAVVGRAAALIVSSAQGEVTAPRCETFLLGFQRKIMLSGAELGLLPAFLRASLVLLLRDECRKLCSDEKDPGSADIIAAAFSSLRTLSTEDMGTLIERCDCTENALKADPSGIYPKMDEETRRYYRWELARLAKLWRVSEYKAAQRAVSLSGEAQGLARHIGWWIFEKPLGMEKAKRKGTLYITANILLTLFLSLLFSFLAESAASFFLILLPASELTKSFLDFVILRCVRPAHIPRMELDGGVPDAGRTVCVISAILSSKDDGAMLARKLEEYSLSNRECGKNLCFGILADLPDTDKQALPGSEIWIEYAANAIAGLNEKYGGGFYLFLRDRVSFDGRWMGRERKRGAMEALMRLLRGENSEMRSLCSPAPEGVKFIIALDLDTRLEPGAARRLIGAALHPLNIPQTDKTKKTVIRGHGIISPRITTSLESAGRSDFSRVFAGPGGTDPYVCPCSEVYMDLFRSGGFAGKGIINIDTYLECMTGRIPDGLVLSHDAVEGAFLRGGYMSDTELTDSFPASSLSYYRRLHRWVRGDWQNISFLFSRGRDLPDIERFRLFDSLRRSLFPVFTFAAIVCGFFFENGGAMLAAAAALAACLTQLLITLGETLFRRDDGRQRFHSSVYYGIGGGLVRTFLRLILLPIEAWFCLSAVFQALWRMLVTKSGLLAWQTAEQTDRLRSPLLKLCSSAAPVFPVCIALIFLSGSVLGRACGIIWLFSPVFAWILSVPAKKEKVIIPRDEAYLRSCAAEIFRYFSDFLTEENHYLPPDNFQEHPPTGLAPRTSPTNIGLALLSVIAAADLECAPAQSCIFLAQKLIEETEKLEKWNGHLYNWYSTTDAVPLLPRYVSTVDSGNLCACLYAAKGALREYGRGDLALRCEKLIGDMRFGELYDNTKRLFHIGIDIETGRKSDSWYDLLSSEARLTGYLAIAEGEVPLHHWRKLSRALKRKNGYRGMASWTGTMFEYLMPELFLPLYHNSLLYESAQFCLYVQKMRTFAQNRPWGTSESAFAALDASMNYRYKAHGCSALALKRGMDDELVISPYSSFLALMHAPRSAMRNLRRLDKLGMRGNYGFWEALDYTGSRSSGSSGAIVRCVMSHHIGMSMISIANYLLDGIMINRFMSEPCMSAFSSLLQERVPLDAVVLEIKDREIPRKTVRLSEEMWSRAGQVGFAEPHECHLLASKNYSVMSTSLGHKRALWEGISPYLPTNPETGRGGIEITVKLDGTEVFRSPLCAEYAENFSWEFSTVSSSIKSEATKVMSTHSIFLPQSVPGEVHEITVSASDYPGEKCTVTLSLQALLARLSDYTAHPAFRKLGLSAKVSEGALIVRRLRGGGNGELFMCLMSDIPCRYIVEPYLFSGRSCEKLEITHREIFLTEPLLSCVCEPDERSDATRRCRYAICMGKSEGEALSAARDALRAQSADFSAMAQQAASVIGLDNRDIDDAFQLLGTLAFPSDCRDSSGTGQENLWKCGISGDIPIVCARFESTENLERARKLMQMHLFLCGCGFDYDLVFITNDGASYRKELHTALSDAMWREGGEVLYGARGGVHIIDEADSRAVRNCAFADLSAFLSSGRLILPRPTPPKPTAKVGRAAAFSLPKQEWTETGFKFYVNRSLPQRVWSMPLTNGSFGYLAADSGMGNMWHINSHENQITPWQGEPTAVRGPETLMLSLGGRLISLFAENDGFTTAVTFSDGTAKWEKTAGQHSFSLTAFVPLDTDARVFIFEGKNLPEDAELLWDADIVMSTGSSDLRYTSSSFADGVFAAYNPRCIESARPFCALSFPAAEDAGSHGGKMRLKTAAMGKCVLVCGCDDARRLKSLCSPDEAESELRRVQAHWREFGSRLELCSTFAALDKILRFLPYQALACRLMARCSIYQNGGAYGFRDQLQDAANLIHLEPSLCREQILRACSRQYLEGDVQHWWHEGDGQILGVRTRCSDDLLWLGWALCEYCEKTGDTSLCRVEVPYIFSLPLREDECDRCERAQITEQTGSVIDHALRAVRLVISRGTGEHGLLRFGSGDWNDGMNEVGGESQWLTWFFCHTVLRLAALLDTLGDEGADEFRKICDTLAESANAAFNGKWFLRGYYRDGSPLGSSECSECRIDSVAQSFAAFCEQADPDKVTQALDSAVNILFDTKNGIVKLFDPPFAGKEAPGYIASYGPGFRENGGQYTHGALWLVRALLHRGDTPKALELLGAILPVEKNPAIYKAEPFVLAADVYSALAHEGEAGWSWYTGAAGWLLRITAEDLLGLRLRGGRLFIEPRLENYEASYLGHKISVKNFKVTVDGKRLKKGGSIPIFESGKD